MKKTKVKVLNQYSGGDLIKQKNPEKVYTGIGRDRVGPGQYESVNEIATKVKGTDWHSSKMKRTAPGEENKGIMVGPGQYNSEKQEIFPVYKYKQSSVFASKVQRSFSQHGPKDKKKKPGQRNTHTENAQRSNFSKTQTIANDDDEDEESDSELEDTATPGPGYYANHYTNSAFRLKGIPERVQFFGSTVERFQDK
jgi:hypothetical protein